MRKLYLAMVEIFWWLEHRRNEALAIYGYRNRKLWERKYCDKFNENIYGGKL